MAADTSALHDRFAHRLVQFAGAFQRRFHMRDDVGLANMVHEIRPVQHFFRLPPRPANYYRAAGLVQAIGQSSSACKPVASIAVMLRTRRITICANASVGPSTSSSLSVVPNRNGPWMRKIGHILRNLLVLKNVRPPVLDVFARDRCDRRRLRHRWMIQQGGERHADLHRDGQIGEDGEGESGGPNRLIGADHSGGCRRSPPLAHVVGDDEQHRGQRRERE